MGGKNSECQSMIRESSIYPEVSLNLNMNNWKRQKNNVCHTFFYLVTGLVISLTMGIQGTQQTLVQDQVYRYVSKDLQHRASITRSNQNSVLEKRQRSLEIRMAI